MSKPCITAKSPQKSALLYSSSYLYITLPPSVICVTEQEIPHETDNIEAICKYLAYFLPVAVVDWNYSNVLSNSFFVRNSHVSSDTPSPPSEFPFNPHYHGVTCAFSHACVLAFFLQKWQANDQTLLLQDTKRLRNITGNQRMSE